ncbi:MAG: hypothetical protein EOM35_03930 [Negativicutes bacterium]|nr:hypothetical protein [Negativicutes bacterium]
MASSSDKFIKTVQAPPSKLAGPIGPDTETIPLQTLEGWSSTTAVVVAIDRYDDATGEITPSKTEIVVGTLGPNGLENVERGVGGTRQNHSDGAVAEISIAAGEQWNRAMDALIGALGQDGKIKGEMIVPGSVGPGAINIDAIYPVGSIYMSVNNTNPSNLFGGTWSAWGAGRVPVGVASSGTFNSVEKTGGAETHTLTIEQIPSHTHGYGGDSRAAEGGGTWAVVGNDGSAGSRVTGSRGGGGAHNNLQPYITCYMWKRVS